MDAALAQPTDEWTGRTVVVTGAARGLGKAYALAFADLGAHVACVDKDTSVTDVAHAAGGNATAYVCDLADGAAIASLAEQIVTASPAIRLLINNAGIAYGEIVDRAAVGAFNHADWMRFLSVNTVAPMTLATALRPALVVGDGVILNQSSMASTDPATAYGVTKAALNAMTRAMAVAFAPDGIRVNAVAPGLIAAEALSAGLSESHAAHVREGQLLARTGSAGDIVALAMFLASNAARFITGEIVFCDGGSHRRHWRY